MSVREKYLNGLCDSVVKILENVSNTGGITKGQMDLILLFKREMKKESVDIPSEMFSITKKYVSNIMKGE